MVEFPQVAKRNALPNKKDRADQSKLGLLVRAYRQKLGLTQEELAWRANMHRTYLADIERGGRNITLRSMLNLASALQVPIEWLFTKVQVQGDFREVLLIEDDPADVDLILRAFKRANFHNPIKVARDGPEAIDYVFCTGPYASRKPESPQLILLDLNLPKLSGLEVLKRIKANEHTRSIPVIVLSASRHDRDIIECSRLGAANYIIKPFSFDSLCRVTPNLNLSWALTNPSGRPEVRAKRDAKTATT